MPSRFPGMDPFVESQAWHDCHTDLIPAIRAELIPLVRPRYTVRIELREYVDIDPPVGESDVMYPDVSIVREPSTVYVARREVETEPVPPVSVRLPMTGKMKERFLEIVDMESNRVVTIIEMLSPSNKRKGGKGREDYLSNRQAVLKSSTHLVEIDLLRGGARLPTIDRLPPADYYVLVSRGNRRPLADVYAWRLRHRLPCLPIPLSNDDPDVLLDLQVAFDTTYDRAGYEYSLNYGRAVEPPLGEDDFAWVRDLLAKSAAD